MNALCIESLTFNYPDGTPALNGLSLVVPEGERLGVVGPNGAGKSTLLNHLNGLLPLRPPDRPAVRIFDMPLISRNLPRVRAEVGLLFQDPDDQLFCSTVWEDVAFGPRQLDLSAAEIRARVDGALARTGLQDYGTRNPARLSEGEKRRACLAGLLACNCRILALDEPSSGLDPRGRRDLKSILEHLPVTQIVATHDLELVVEICTRVIVLDGGCLIADGAPQRVLSDEQLMLRHGLEVPHILKHRHPHS